MGNINQATEPTMRNYLLKLAPDIGILDYAEEEIVRGHTHKYIYYGPISKIPFFRALIKSDGSVDTTVGSNEDQIIEMVFTDANNKQITIAVNNAARLDLRTSSGDEDVLAVGF